MPSRFSRLATRRLSVEVGMPVRRLAAETHGPQDSGEIFPRTAQQRHHGRRDGEAALAERAFGRGLGALGRLPGNERADEIGEALQHVDAHRAPAADLVADSGVVAGGDLGIDRHRHQALG